MGALCVGRSYADSTRIVLITADEAQLPLAANADLTFRAGISRGPAIELVSPKPSGASVQSPVHLQLKFEGRGGAQIDPDSLVDPDEPRQRFRQTNRNRCTGS